MNLIHRALLSLVALLAAGPAFAAPLTYEGTDGPGKGKHVVFMAGDHEYRSEETLPAIARLLAKHHGFKCTVLFNIDPATGEIVAGNSNMPGLEALETADLLVIFTRFQQFPPEQMKHVDAYLSRGGPVVGLRTATHGFKTSKDYEFAKYSYDSKVAGYELGFGHQVLGQTWVGHYGTNHKQSTRITVVDGKKDHPILRGVKDVWVHVGAYVGKPVDGEVLTTAQPLDGMTPDSPPDAKKPPQPSEWTRTYKSASGKVGRVFTTLYGTSEDITNDGYRRLLVNGCFWAAGLEDAIKPDMNVALVGAAKPNTFNGGGYARGIKPEMYAGFESPIPAKNNIAAPKPAAPKGEKAKDAKPGKAAANADAAVQTVAAKADAQPEPKAAAPAGEVVATGKPARFVRIELPGDKRILTLAEVEVIAGGKNVARDGKATQSSTNGSAAASRAIDGNKSPDYNAGGQTHTTNAGSKDPWWELDLGKDMAVEKVQVWNRSGFESRLDGFTLKLLDAERKEVFRAAGVAAGESVAVDVANKGQLAYLTYDGKPGKPTGKGNTAVAAAAAPKGGAAKKPAEGKKPAAPKEDATLVAVPADYRDPTPFAFQKGDVVAVLGNGLPDRFQHDGWFETLLQSQLGGQ
ncbi:MAG TPA: ThuA domain-containing protein, partial [Humisphaera sp.]